MSGISSNLREAFGEPDPRIRDWAQPTWDERVLIGKVVRYRNTLELRVSKVVKQGIHSVILETIELDLAQRRETLKSWVPLSLTMIPGVLRGLLEAERILADLEGTAEAEWPPFPIKTGEGVDGITTVRVLVDLYNSRLEAKLSTSIAGNPARNGKWAKFSPADIHEIGRLLLQAFDHASSSSSPPSDSGSLHEDPIPF